MSPERNSPMRKNILFPLLCTLLLCGCGARPDSADAWPSQDQDAA